MSSVYLKSIEINNYKNFKYFKVEDFKQFNLIFGKNSVGKTNFLEVLNLYLNMYNPSHYILTFGYRNIGANNLEILFYNCDYNNSIIIKVVNSDTKKLTIYPIKSLEHLEKLDGIYYEVLNNKKLIKLPLLINRLRQLDNSFYPINNKIPMLNGEEVLSSFFNYREFVSYYINNLFNNNIEAFNVVTQYFDSLQSMKQDKLLVDILSSIVPDIESIRVSMNLSCEVDIGLNRYLPISFLGEGILKIFNYIVVALSVKNGILLIDEIDNGFHHSALRKLWTALFDICFKHNIQLFATTHSYECIDSFVDVYNEVREKYNSNDDIQGIRINADLKEKGKYNPIIYDSNRLSSAIEDSFEVR